MPEQLQVPDGGLFLLRAHFKWHGSHACTEVTCILCSNAGSRNHFVENSFRFTVLRILLPAFEVLAIEFNGMSSRAQSPYN